MLHISDEILRIKREIAALRKKSDMIFSLHLKGSNMPSPNDREQITNNAFLMVMGVHQQLPQAVVESLQKHLRSYLWNLECLVNALPAAVNLPDVVPGFGLLVCKSRAWTPSRQEDSCDGIPGEQLDVMRQLLGRVAEAILPQRHASTAPSYQHFETEDGLICALYRMEDAEAILAAAGVEFPIIDNIPGSDIPTGGLSSASIH